MAIAPYYWKPSQDGLFEHFAAIMQATSLPFIAYHNSPTIMDGIRFAPATLGQDDAALSAAYRPQGGKPQLGESIPSSAAARARCATDFGLFVGTEWMIPSLTLGGSACMSVFGGIAPRFDASRCGTPPPAGAYMTRSRCSTSSPTSIRSRREAEYPAPTKAMWDIMGRPVGAPRPAEPVR